jgi:hypothetical protein
MSEDPIDAVASLKPYQTVHLKADGGPEFEITRLDGGTYVHRDGDTNSCFVPRSTEFKFLEREERRRDAVEQLQDFEEGYGL